MSSVKIINAASVVLYDAQGRVLLVQRGNPENYGLWSLPGGKQQAGETLEETAAREVREETGLDISIHSPLWVQTVAISDKKMYKIQVFQGSLIPDSDQTLNPGDDARDAVWVEPQRLDEYNLTEGLFERLST